MSEPLTELVATKLTKADAERLAKLAEQQDRSVAWLVRQAILHTLATAPKS